MNLLRRLFPGSAAPDVRWVAQEEGQGCAVACVAMILGTSYWSARTLFPHFDPAVGLCSADVLRVLGEYGYAYNSKFPHYSPERRDRSVWPVKPFAPLHLVATRTGGWHAVVMTSAGEVFDPLQYAPQLLRWYPEVLEIHGLWRVA